LHKLAKTHVNCSSPNVWVFLAVSEVKVCKLFVLQEKTSSVSNTKEPQDSSCMASWCSCC